MMATTPGPDTPEPTTAELIAARPHLAMHAMDGLVMDDVPLNAIADAAGTPIWVYSAATMRAAIVLAAALTDAGLDAQIHYAVKANDRLAVLRLFARRALAPTWSARANSAARAPPAFRPATSCSPALARRTRTAPRAGRGHRPDQRGKRRGAGHAFGLAAALGRTARVALRVNPDVDAGTHAKITTGRARTIRHSVCRRRRAVRSRGGAAGYPPVGLATHIGSQILSLAPYRAAYARLAELVRTLRQRA